MPLDPNIIAGIGPQKQVQPLDVNATMNDIAVTRANQALAAQRQQTVQAEQEMQRLAGQYGDDYDGLAAAVTKRFPMAGQKLAEQIGQARKAAAEAHGEQVKAARADLQSELSLWQGADETTGPAVMQETLKKFPQMAPLLAGRQYSNDLRDQIAQAGRSQDSFLDAQEKAAEAVAKGDNQLGVARLVVAADTPQKQAAVAALLKPVGLNKLLQVFPDQASAQAFIDAQAKAAAEEKPQTPETEAIKQWTAEHGRVPTYAERLQIRKQFGQADDRPRVSVSVAGGATGPVTTDPAVMARIAGLTPEALDQSAQRYHDDGTLPTRYSQVAKAQIQNRAAQMFPGSHLAFNVAAYKADSKALGQLTTQLNAVEAFEKTGLKNLKLFTDAAAKIPDTGIPWLNAPVRALSANFVGSENMAAVNAARQVALTEIARVVANPNLTGILSDSAREEILGLSPANATFAQIKRVAHVLEQDMANRKQSMREQVANIRGELGEKQKPSTTPPEKVPTGTIKIGKYLVTPK